MVTFLIWVGAAVCVYSLVMSVVLIRKQQNRGAMEKSLSGAITKHPLAANPMIIAYIVFPVAVIVGAVLLAVFFKW